MIAASLLTVAGAFALLYVFIVGGQAWPLEIFPGFEASSSFGDGQIAAYAPRLPELLLGMGGVAIALLITVVGVRVLPFAPDDDARAGVPGARGETADGRRAQPAPRARLRDPQVVGQDDGRHRAVPRVARARADGAGVQEGPGLHRSDVADGRHRPPLPQSRSLPVGGRRVPRRVPPACGRGRRLRRRGQQGALRRAGARRQQQQRRAGEGARPAGRPGHRRARHDARHRAADPRLPGVRPGRADRRRDPQQPGRQPARSEAADGDRALHGRARAGRAALRPAACHHGALSRPHAQQRSRRRGAARRRDRRARERGRRRGRGAAHRRRRAAAWPFRATPSPIRFRRPPLRPAHRRRPGPRIRLLLRGRPRCAAGRRRDADSRRRAVGCAAPERGRARHRRRVSGALRGRAGGERATAHEDPRARSTPDCPCTPSAAGSCTWPAR